MASDIQSILVGETWRRAGMVARASGGPIVAGTVSYYLKCLSGDNADKWWDDAGQVWADEETANSMTHQADGCWTIELSESPFEAGAVYLEYAKESGNLHVAGEGRLLRGTSPTAWLEDSVDGVLVENLLQLLLASALNVTVRDIRHNRMNIYARDGTTLLATITYDPAKPGEITRSVIH